MTYIAEKPSVSSSAGGRQLITIEFAPDIHKEESEYSYDHPQFVFGDRVELSNAGLNYPPIQYTVTALELVESKTNQGKLLNQPCWKYKIFDGEKTLWKEESALIRHGEKTTCLQCPQFNNYHQPDGSGWCEQFNQKAKTFHIQTHDCVLNLNTSEFTEAFSTEIIELDRDGYPMGEQKVENAYFNPNFVTCPNEPF